MLTCVVRKFLLHGLSVGVLALYGLINVHKGGFLNTNVFDNLINWHYFLREVSKNLTVLSTT